MTAETECILSYYREIAAIGTPERQISIVQHRESEKIYLKKRVSAAGRQVYQALLAHPVAGLPRLYEVLEDGDTLILVEEYLSGDTLQEYLEEHGPLAEPEALRCAIQLCRIVGALHALPTPVLHRDIKPSNIMLTPDGTVKLLDLDAAKLYQPAGPDHRMDTTLLGTVGYAAPEQYGFQPSTVQTDLYSIGVLLNVMLTGKLPGEQLADGAPRPVIEQCTRLSPAERYSSAAMLERALTAQLPDGQRHRFEPDRQAGHWRQFLPPGFRNSSPPAKLLAGFGYLTLICYCGTLTMEDIPDPADLALNRWFLFAALLTVIFFSGNYRNVQQYVPLARSRNWWLRIIGIVLADAVILLLYASAVVMLEALFFPAVGTA